MSLGPVAAPRGLYSACESMHICAGMWVEKLADDAIAIFLCTPRLPRHHAKVPGALVLLRAPALTAVARRLAARNDRKGEWHRRWSCSSADEVVGWEPNARDCAGCA